MGQTLDETQEQFDASLVGTKRLHLAEYYDVSYESADGPCSFRGKLLEHMFNRGEPEQYVFTDGVNTWLITGDDFTATRVS